MSFYFILNDLEQTSKVLINAVNYHCLELGLCGIVWYCGTSGRSDSWRSTVLTNFILNVSSDITVFLHHTVFKLVPHTCWKSQFFSCHACVFNAPDGVIVLESQHVDEYSHDWAAEWTDTNAVMCWTFLMQCERSDGSDSGIYQCGVPEQSHRNTQLSMVLYNSVLWQWHCYAVIWICCKVNVFCFIFSFAGFSSYTVHYYSNFAGLFTFSMLHYNSCI